MLKTIKKLWLICEVIALFIFDFFAAVWDVTTWLFKPNRDMQAVIVRMESRLRHPLSLWILGMIIFLTPGSLIVEIDSDKGELFIHFFHAPNPDQELLKLEQRFEKRLYEIFHPGGI